MQRQGSAAEEAVPAGRPVVGAVEQGDAEPEAEAEVVAEEELMDAILAGHGGGGQGQEQGKGVRAGEPCTAGPGVDVDPMDELELELEQMEDPLPQSLSFGGIVPEGHPGSMSQSFTFDGGAPGLAGQGHVGRGGRLGGGPLPPIGPRRALG